MFIQFEAHRLQVRQRDCRWRAAKGARHRGAVERREDDRPEGVAALISLVVLLVRGHDSRLVLAKSGASVGAPLRLAIPPRCRNRVEATLGLPSPAATVMLALC